MGSHVSSNSVSVCSQIKLPSQPGILQQAAMWSCRSPEGCTGAISLALHHRGAQHVCGIRRTRPSSGRFLYGANRDTGRPSSLQHPAHSVFGARVLSWRHLKHWCTPP